MDKCSGWSNNKRKRKILETKKQNNKGFTLVELVIVIAVIAILVGVLIGIFASVIARANQSKALQVAKAAFDGTWVEFFADEHEITTWITD